MHCKAKKLKLTKLQQLTQVYRAFHNYHNAIAIAIAISVAGKFGEGKSDLILENG